MTLFWIISAAMIVAALALLAPTLLRRHEVAADDTRQLNVDIAREHLRELTKQKDAGELSAEEFVQAKQDLETALAHDLAGSEASPLPSKRPGGGRAALLLSAVLVPLIAIPTYLEIGSPGLIERSSTMAAAPAGHGGDQLPPISELAAQLRERMEANPDNPEGWFLLGRTYMRLGDYDGAVYAFEQVVQRLPEEVAALLSLADALILQNGRKVPELAENLLQRALELEPDSVTALWLLGNAAADKGDNATALQYWEKAYPMLDSEPEMQADLGQMIRVAGGTVPESPAALPPIMPLPETAPQAQAAVDTAAPPADTGTAQPGGDGASIGVEVALAPHLMERAEPGDTVFVLARAENGPPMPLAVSRHRVSELPLAITLTDAMAMMPAMRLSAFPRVSVTAKVSKSGQAGTQAGDLLAEAIIVDQSQPDPSVQLLINQVAN
jgi:cytochrome c-type biogenesis protein CcmH